MIWDFSIKEILSIAKLADSSERMAWWASHVAFRTSYPPSFTLGKNCFNGRFACGNFIKILKANLPLKWLLSRVDEGGQDVLKATWKLIRPSFHLNKPTWLWKVFLLYWNPKSTPSSNNGKVKVWDCRGGIFTIKFS